MAKLSEKEMESYYSRTHGNDREILNSDTCSCLFCRQTYSARDVSDWVNDDDGSLSAICPICGMEAVVGDKKKGRISHEDLKELNLRYFGKNYMEEHSEALMTYIYRYRSGEISKKKSNEDLFKHYLGLMIDQGVPEAALTLGGVYFYGTEWTKKDLDMAMTVYTMPLLKNNRVALTQIGQILQSDNPSQEDHELARELYSKAMALDTGLAVLKYADCYLYGRGVEKDVELARSIYSNLWDSYYELWANAKGRDNVIFGDVAFRLGLCYEEADKHSDNATGREALISFLVADCAFEMALGKNTDAYVRSSYFRDAEREKNAVLVKEKIKQIQEKDGLEAGKPVGDINTLNDISFLYGGLICPKQKYTLHLDSYDETTGEIHFAIFSEEAQFIVDSGDLFAGFVEGNTYWTVYGTIKEPMKGDAEINYIQLIDHKYLFISKVESEDDDPDPVLFIKLSVDESEDEPDETLGGNLA